MRRDLTRRELLKAGGGAFLGISLLGLAGCAGGGTGGGGELRMSWWGSNERNQRTIEALELFQERNPEIDISTEYTGDFAEYWNRLATQASGGNAPDVMQTDYRYMSEYSRRGILMELDEHIPDPIDLSNFEEQDLGGGRIDGKNYGITLGNNSQIIAYDVARFEDTGVEPPAASWTLDDLTRMSRQLAKSGGDGYFGIVDGGGTEPWLEAFLIQKGLGLYENGQIAFGEEDLVEWWTYWDEMREAGAAPPADITAANEGASIEDSLLIQDRCAMSYAFSNQYTALVAATDKEIELSALPSRSADSQPGQYLKPSMLISAFSRTEYTDESTRLINFFLNDMEANRILGTERGVSGNAEVREMLRSEVPADERKVIDFLDTISENDAPLPPPPPQGAAEIDQLTIRTNQNIAFGRTSIEEAASRFVSEAERILEQAGG